MVVCAGHVFLAVALGGWRRDRVTANAGALSPAFGFGRGFDDYDAELAFAPRARRRTPFLAARLLRGLSALDSLPGVAPLELFGRGVSYRRAPEITDAAIERIDRAGDRTFFLFVNYFDAHWPYAPPAGCRGGLAPGASRDSREFMRAIEEVTRGDRLLSAGEYDQLSDLYDAELGCLDRELTRLIDRLRAHPAWDEMLVVITSDHGDALGEHGYVWHGVHLYDELVRVPMVIRPGNSTRGAPPRGSRITGPLQSVDVFPTILEHAGVDALEEIDGLAYGRGRREVRSWSFVKQRFVRDARWNPSRFLRELRSLEVDGDKIIVSSSGARELYDLASDPGETRNRASLERERAEALSAVLRAGEPRQAVRAPAPESDEALERLRALGYVE